MSRSQVKKIRRFFDQLVDFILLSRHCAAVQLVEQPLVLFSAGHEDEGVEDPLGGRLLEVAARAPKLR